MNQNSKNYRRTSKRRILRLPDDRYGRSARHRQMLRNRLNKYGVTIEMYSAMLEKQGGACAICFKCQNELDTELAVDHDHKSGKVRGLLCRDCNRGLGAFYDNPDVLLAAGRYLLGHT